MKTLLTRNVSLISLALLIFSQHSFSQLSNGGVHAYFGVDADTKSGYVKYGPATGLIASDDWFGPMTGTTRGVVDTSNTAYYKSQLQISQNISFTKRMAVPMYTKVNSTLWLDGIYARDHISQKSITGAIIGRDSTSFGGGSKKCSWPAAAFGW